MKQVFQNKTVEFDCIVCGGGIGGVCAAIMSARRGLKTALIQNRPVLGGNASSEVRVHIGDATEHGYHNDCRSTGIIEELRLETAYRDPYNEYFWIDTVLFSFCEQEPNLSLFLNTNVFDITMNDNKIISVIGIQTGTEIKFEFKGKIFIDGTGDGTLGYLSGAEFRIGRESKNEFNESIAPEKADNHTLGASILFQARNIGREIKFTPPKWAIKFDKEKLKYRRMYGKSDNHGELYWHSDSSGWWWVELGGMMDSIHDNEEIRFQLQSIVFGLWDWIKNHDEKTKETSKNYEITWIGQIPGKRESRRLIGDHILHQNDLTSMKVFDDQIAIGGWSIDLHPPKGFWSTESGAKHTMMELPYTIPFRSIYSKNISNLLISSRCVSATHVAHGSTRLIGTLACIGQAAGLAASFCIRNNYFPRDLLHKDIKNLQQELLKEDQYLIGIKNIDCNDLALNAQIHSNSEHSCEFGNPSRFIEVYFPMAQRFYLPPNKNATEKPKISLYLKNTSDNPLKITGGIRLDNERYEFKSKEDLTLIKGNIPPKYEGWVEFLPELASFNFNQGGCYWIYLNEQEKLMWAKNEEVHWNGFRLGYQNEETEEWKTVRINGTPFFDEIIGFYGVFCFKLENVPSPFPVNAINNGEHHPDYSPNLWISQPFRTNLFKDPNEIESLSIMEENINVNVEFQEESEIHEFWLTFDTELNNAWPHQGYGREKIKDPPIIGKSNKCIRNMDIYFENKEEKMIQIAKITDNYQRRVKIILEKPIKTKKIVLKPRSTWGFNCFNLYELRIY